MEQDEIKYNQLVNRLKHTPPILVNPEVLTNAIISQINDLSGTQKVNPFVLVAGWLSATAAVVLIALLVSQQATNQSMPLNQSVAVQAIPEIQYKSTNNNEKKVGSLSAISTVMNKQQVLKARKERIYALYKRRAEK